MARCNECGHAMEKIVGGLLTWNVLGMGTLSLSPADFSKCVNCSEQLIPARTWVAMEKVELGGITDD